MPSSGTKDRLPTEKPEFAKTPNPACGASRASCAGRSTLRPVGAWTSMTEDRRLAPAMRRARHRATVPSAGRRQDEAMQLSTGGRKAIWRRRTGMIVARDDGMVRWLTFDRPDKRNALSQDMLERALEEVRRFGADDASRVLILTGGGDRAFVSGADISEFGRGPGAERRYLDLGARLFHEIHRLPKPTIAMIRGYCFGGGVALATACDLRYASDDALFSIPAAKLGIAYDVDLAKRLVDLAGPAAAKEMLFTGRRYDAAQAERMGAREPDLRRRRPRAGNRRPCRGNRAERAPFRPQRQVRDSPSPGRTVRPGPRRMRTNGRGLRRKRGFRRRARRLRRKAKTRVPRQMIGAGGTARRQKMRAAAPWHLPEFGHRPQEMRTSDGRFHGLPAAPPRRRGASAKHDRARMRANRVVGILAVAASFANGLAEALDADVGHLARQAGERTPNG